MLAEFVLSLMVFQASAQTGPVASGDYCAFEVLVRSSKGSPVTGVSVLLHDHGGEEFNSAVTDSAGVARICDAPPGLLSIQVGVRRCGGVTVHNLRRFWLETRKVSLTYDNCAGEEWVPVLGCQLVIRVRNQDGFPIPGAVYIGGGMSARPGSQPKAADYLGRIFLFTEFDKQPFGRIESPGYSAFGFVGNECTRSASRDEDVVVKLRRSEPR